MLITMSLPTDMGSISLILQQHCLTDLIPFSGSDLYTDLLIFFFNYLYTSSQKVVSSLSNKFRKQKRFRQ